MKSIFEKPSEMTIQSFNKNEYLIDNNLFEYSIKQLLSIIGIEFNTGAQDNTLSIEGINIIYTDFPVVQSTTPCIIIRKFNFDILINQPDRLTASWMNINELIPPIDLKESIQKIPIITIKENEDDKKIIDFVDEKTVIFNLDIIAITFFMLSRIEEFDNEDLDKRGRFKAMNCLAYKLGFLDHPIVDEYAIILREWMKYLRPSINIKNIGFKVLMTHDIDHVFKKQNIIDGSQNNSPYLAHQSHNLEENSYYLAINDLIEYDQKRGLKSIFYLMSSLQTEYDDGYDLSSAPMLKIIDRIKKCGFTIGLHSSYMAVDDYDLLIRQKSSIEKIAKIDCEHIRQHYIRFKMPGTWVEFSQAGLKNDSSLLYREVGGFRFGTCHPFRVINAKNRNTINLIEMPVIIMDVHLWNAEYSDDDRIKIVQNLKNRCQSVNGVYTIIVHNDTLIDNSNIGKIIYDSI
jgi:hypothetical protein